MPMIVRCPRCEKALRVRDELGGKRVRCPCCQDAFVSGPSDMTEDGRRPPLRAERDDELAVGVLDAIMADALPPDLGDGQLPFERLGHYRVVRRIGRGGMGDVYLGYEESLDRPVAIKVLPAEYANNEALVRRFRSEAAAVARLAHPNLVPVYFVGRDGDHHFFAMQYVEGESLDRRLVRQGRLDASAAADVLEQCLSGLGVAHQAGLVHRDVKPGNILLEAGTGRALLADFGLAKLVGAGAGLTRTGVVVGTVSYLSPEQARGEKVDHRSDLYSLGVVAYQMLSGRLPFESDTPSRMLFQHAYETPRPLQEVAPEVPAALAAVVTRLLAKEPARRYSSSAEALSDLRHGRSQAAPVPSPEREAVAQGSPGRPPAPPRGEDRTEALPVAPPRLGRRRLVLLGAVALLLLAGGLTVWLWPRRGPDERGEPGGDSPPVAGGAPAPAGRAEGAGAPRPEDNSDGKVPPLVVPDPLRVPQPAAVRDRPLAVCSGHGQAVLSVAVSPERRYLLSGSKDKSTRLWDGKTGKLLRSSTEPTYWVLALAFSPDGQLAVSPRDPSALRVWEVESGKERCQFTGHKSSVRSAVFSADGRYVFSGGPLRGLFLWDVTNGKMVRNFVGQPQDVTCVAMSQDSRWALSGGCAGSLVLWDLEAGKGRPLAGHPASCLVGVGFCANDRVVSADGTRMIRVWDRGGRLLRQIEVQCDGPVQQAAFSPRGDRALCACDDGTLRLLDLNNGKEIACLRGHPGGVMAVAFSPDGRLAASGGNDCTMRLWELPR